jgi:hypothetical protein
VPLTNNDPISYVAEPSCRFRQRFYDTISFPEAPSKYIARRSSSSRRYCSHSGSLENSGYGLLDQQHSQTIGPPVQDLLATCTFPRLPPWVVVLVQITGHGMAWLVILICTPYSVRCSIFLLSPICLPWSSLLRAWTCSTCDDAIKVINLHHVPPPSEYINNPSHESCCTPPGI